MPSMPTRHLAHVSGFELKTRPVRFVHDGGPVGMRALQIPDVVLKSPVQERVCARSVHNPAQFADKPLPDFGEGWLVLLGTA